MILELLLGFGSALALSYILLPILINLARKKQLFDLPEGRKAHQHPVPALGGIAIFFGFWISSLLLVGDAFLLELRYLLIGAFLLMLVGIKDDLLGVDAPKKLLLQFVVVCLLYYAGFRLEGFYGLFAVGEVAEWLRFPMTVVFLLGLINAYNLIDGIDGLAGSLSLTSASIFALLFYLQGDFGWCLLALALGGSLLGFLRFNFYKASIFMGDNGSMVLGLLIGVFAIHYLNLTAATPQSATAVPIVFSLIAIPTLDMLRVSIFRMMKGRSPFAADRSHIHHILLRQGFSTPLICLLLVALEFLLCILAGQLSSISISRQLLLQSGTLLLLTWGICLLRKRIILNQSDSVFSK